MAGPVQIPNGAPAVRPPIQFGSQLQPGTRSPSPIPQPAMTGGRPPSAFAGQGNGITFGTAPSVDVSSQTRPAPQGPMIPPNQAVHLRRESSQSSNTDLPNTTYGSASNRGGYMSQQNRRGNYTSPYPQTMGYSPAAGFRQMGRQPSNVSPYYQNQVPQYPNSPHQPSRSPGFQGSHPGTPTHQQPVSMMNGVPMQYQQPPYGSYQQHLATQQAQFGVQQPFDPSMTIYNQNSYSIPPPYLGQQQQFVSQSQLRQAPPTAAQQYIQGQYSQQQSQNMSRTASQASDQRPPSSVGHIPVHRTPSVTPGPSSTPSQSASGGASATFTIPTQKKVVIKNAAGEVVTFDNKITPPQSTPPAPSRSPAHSNASSSKTPPPRPVSSSSHGRSESKSGTKTAQEIRAEFLEQVRRGQAETKPVVEEETKDRPTIVEPVPEPEDDAADTEPETDEIGLIATPDEQPSDVAASEQGETEEERRKREEEEEEERMIAEMEAAEKEREEKERTFKEKKSREAEERKKEENSKADEEMRRLEREAEEAEEARQKEKEKNNEDESEEAKAEKESLFAALKKSNLGPAASSPSGAETPTSESSPMPTPPLPPTSTATKPKPTPLKLDTTAKQVIEPSQPTAGMQALKSARMLQIQVEHVAYPEGIKSPDPALIQGGKRNGRLYDKAFLLQFQPAFKEKPTLDWDQRLKETLAENADSAGPKSARTPGGAGSGRNQPPRAGPQAVQQRMGTFAHPGPTLPPGTTSEQRFAASMGRPGPAMSNPLAGFAPRPGAFPMPMQQRHQSSTGLQQTQSPRPSHRGQDASKRGRLPSRKQEQEANTKMPMTAGQEVKPLEFSSSGWKAASAGRPAPPVVDVSGHMPPDVVQRKVQAALNKLTPEKFDKVGDQIVEIAQQSKDETDGRTLRQVIQLTFEKACDEAHWASMYARFCMKMQQDISDEIKDDSIQDKDGNATAGGRLFRKYLLFRCQEDFERGWEVNLPQNLSEADMMSDEYYKAVAAKRKGLGLVQFIGELYKLRMLTIKIMHQCFMKLLDFTGPPDESAIESLVKLMKTVGGTMVEDRVGSQMVESYFERIDNILAQEGLPSRLRFMLMDLVDLRKNGWTSKDDQKGPKTIQQIHEEAQAAQAAAEADRLRNNQRGGRPPQGRGDARSFSTQNPPPDYKNEVASLDLKRLGNRNASRQTNAGGSKTFGGPSTAFSRTASGRQGLGPQVTMMARSDSSNPMSRSASSKGESKADESKSSVNAFSALATLDADGADKTPTSSPPMTNKPLPSSTESKTDAS